MTFSEVCFMISGFINIGSIGFLSSSTRISDVLKPVSVCFAATVPDSLKVCGSSHQPECGKLCSLTLILMEGFSVDVQL